MMGQRVESVLSRKDVWRRCQVSGRPQEQVCHWLLGCARVRTVFGRVRSVVEDERRRCAGGGMTALCCC
ncbi:hypothetical protein CBR_g18854 [Chara braunii]|uniref:Uncharacterized protein n=1 Tax=Chara braunii TaxID=69332 RepID=A0A388KWT5_CHABU|nr:hypothetical protein CBR_g18854 [Chara braunii]|eukprot:GBG74442.1 hypothetical protein CBR_g18854 [Chara braunii]